MTLIELLVAVGLSIMLVTVAAFVFTQAQKVFGRINNRLETTNGFRTAFHVLEQDLARMESPRDKVVSGGQLTGTAPWLSITPGGTGFPNTHTDSIAFVTHANVAVLDAPNSTNPALYADRLVYVVYRLDNISTGAPYDHGLIRECNLISKIDASGNATIDNSLLPNNNPAPPSGPQTPLHVSLVAQARGLQFRYAAMASGTFSPCGGGTVTGGAFYSGSSGPPNTLVSTPPTAIELTIFAPEKEKTNPSLMLSTTRTIEVLAPR
jgi:hypothetical protein